MPHGGHDNDDVEVVYNQLEDLLRDTFHTEMLQIVAGDFNAEIGFIDETVHMDPVGQNERGLWLQAWCAFHGLHIANICSNGLLDSCWTFRNGLLRKQLDYFLVNARAHAMVNFCRVSGDLDTGSDHRAVELVLKVPRMSPKIVRGKKGRHWRVNTDRLAYKQALDTRLATGNQNLQADPVSSASFLEEQMVGACAKAVVEKQKRSCHCGNFGTLCGTAHVDWRTRGHSS